MSQPNMLAFSFYTALLCFTPQAWAENRDLKPFEHVNYSVPFNVEFVLSDTPFVTLEGDEDTIEEITTEVKDDVLHIRKESRWFDWSDGDVLITVGYPSIASINMAGSGDGYAEEINTDQLRLTISGSAELELDQLVCNDLIIVISGSGGIKLNDLDADTMNTRITGSGDVEASGRVVTQDIAITGSGDVQATDLRAQEVEVAIRGSGDAKVWALASLNAKVTGSGDIAYYGNPQVHESILGSGNIKHRGEK
jgi:putative autotransporter adhesin-like protein